MSVILIVIICITSVPFVATDTLEQVTPPPPTSTYTDSSGSILLIVVIVLAITLGLSLLLHVCCAVKLCRLCSQKRTQKKESKSDALKLKQLDSDQSTLKLSSPGLATVSKREEEADVLTYAPAVRAALGEERYRITLFAPNKITNPIPSANLSTLPSQTGPVDQKTAYQTLETRQLPDVPHEYITLKKSYETENDGYEQLHPGSSLAYEQYA